MSPIGLVVLLAGALAAAEAGERLVGQRVEGNERLCVYETQGLIQAEREVQRVGVAEPCPDRIRRPDPPRRVPLMAQLSRSFVRERRRICIYAYAGHEYERAIPLVLSCSITP